MSRREAARLLGRSAAGAILANTVLVAGKTKAMEIIAHPAVTCAIPATSNARHLEDNMHGGVGTLPDTKMRQRMVETIERL